MFLVYELGGFALLYGWPALVATTGILLVVSKQPRWASAVGIVLTVIAGLASVAMWFLYGISDPRGAYVAMAICVVTGAGVVGIGAARLPSSWRVTSRTARAAA